MTLPADYKTTSPLTVRALSAFNSTGRDFRRNQNAPNFGAHELAMLALQQSTQRSEKAHQLAVSCLSELDKPWLERESIRSLMDRY